MFESQYTALFEYICNKRGWKFKKSNAKQDMKDHIDCFVTICNGNTPIRRFAVDLKGDKYTSKANKGDKKCLCQYIEFLNVNGDKGWLFGKADYIAVLNENEDGFYLIPRVRLISFAEELFDVDLSIDYCKMGRMFEQVGCENNLWVNSPLNSYHKLYHRHSRPKEIVTQIDMDDIKSLCKISIMK